MDQTPTKAQRFEGLYRAHYAAITRFVHRRINAASVEEIVAETFAIAWRRLDDVPENPLPWLYVVARNVMNTDRRAAASRRDKAARLQATTSDRSCDPADTYAERDHARRALMTLSETDREALRLIAWDGLAQRDAARICSTSRAAFAMRLSRARRRLAAALAELDDPAPLSATSRVQESKT